MKIVNTRVNHLVNPIGYQLPHLSFSYVVEEAEGTKQAAAQIVIYADPYRQQVLYDTGKQEQISSLSHNIDLKLESCTRYYWTVKVWSDAGEEAESELSVELGTAAELMSEFYKGMPQIDETLEMINQALMEAALNA